MRGQLKLRGLGVVRTPGTHRRGAALGVPITEDAGRYQARVLDLGKRYSDHCVSMVQTGVVIPQTYRTTTEMKGCSTNVLWNCEKKKWAKALQRVTGIAKHQGHTFQETVLKMQAKRPPHRAQIHIINMMVVLMHTVYVVAGHVEGLVHVAGINKGPQTRNTMETFLLEQETRQYRETKSKAQLNPDDTEAKAQEVIQWVWLQQAREALNDDATNIQMPKGFVTAAKAGKQALQKWATKAAEVTLPDLVVETQQQADRVQEFRGEVSKLDPRCSPQCEDAAWAEVVSTRHTYQRLTEEGTAQPKPYATMDDKDPAGTFVSQATMRRLLRKRKPTKASA